MMPALVSLLINAGPTLIRSVGSLFGEKGSKAAETAADIVESVAGLEDRATAEAIAAKQLDRLPSETLLELENLKVKLAAIEAEREKTRLTHERGMHEQTQHTIRQGEVGGDDYVKQTRPKIARLSTYAAISYVFAFEMLAFFYQTREMNWAVLSAIYSPALTYMGMRTVDAFSKHKQEAGLKGISD